MGTLPCSGRELGSPWALRRCGVPVPYGIGVSPLEQGLQGPWDPVVSHQGIGVPLHQGDVESPSPKRLGCHPPCTGGTRGPWHPAPVPKGVGVSPPYQGHVGTPTSCPVPPGNQGHQGVPILMPYPIWEWGPPMNTGSPSPPHALRELGSPWDEWGPCHPPVPSGSPKPWGRGFPSPPKLPMVPGPTGQAVPPRTPLPPSPRVGAHIGAHPFFLGCTPRPQTPSPSPALAKFKG